MQIIDDKGRVLGIVNIIDLTVVLFIAAVITGAFWLAYNDQFKEMFKGQVIDLTKAAQEPPKDANVTITFLRIPHYTANQINENTTIYHGSQQFTPITVKMTPVPIEINNISYYDMDMTIRLRVTKIAEHFVYKYVPAEYRAILIGSEFPIKTEKLEISGIVTDVKISE